MDKSETLGEVLYSETMFYSAWFYLIIVLLFGFLLTMAVLAAVGGAVLTPILLILLLLLLSLTYGFFSRLRFVVTGNKVVFGFARPFRKQLPRSSLQSCEPHEITFKTYLGFGPRPGLDGTMGYVARNGPGVQLVFDGAPRPYVISVRDPERVCELLTPTL